MNPKETAMARKPMGRLGTAEEIAEVALYVIVSAAAAFVTGGVFLIGGGLSL